MIVCLLLGIWLDVICHAHRFCKIREQRHIHDCRSAFDVLPDSVKSGNRGTSMIACPSFDVLPISSAIHTKVDELREQSYIHDCLSSAGCLGWR